MRIFANGFTKAHVKVFLALYIPFSILLMTLAIPQGSFSARDGWAIARTAAGVITGPMVGAIYRDMVAYFVRDSLRVMRVCALPLIFAILYQCLYTGTSRGARVVRLVVWGTGWFVWFAGGVASMALTKG